jgi:hypothetical protein
MPDIKDAGFAAHDFYLLTDHVQAVARTVDNQSRGTSRLKSCSTDKGCHDSSVPGSLGTPEGQPDELLNMALHNYVFNPSSTDPIQHSLFSSAPSIVTRVLEFFCHV